TPVLSIRRRATSAHNLLIVLALRKCSVTDAIISASWKRRRTLIAYNCASRRRLTKQVSPHAWPVSSSTRLIVGGGCSSIRLGLMSPVRVLNSDSKQKRDIWPSSSLMNCAYSARCSYGHH